MLKMNNFIRNNLEEQVQYLTDFHNVNQGVAQWGIKIIGQIADASELPEDFNGDYGDAYAVGTEAPYFFYIWTRTDINGDSGYWFPFGEISIVGPVGPVGPQGPQGEKGEATPIYVGNVSGSFKVGDLRINSSGKLQQWSGTSWVDKVSLMGPQGPQGNRGPQGPQGVQGEQGPEGPLGLPGVVLDVKNTLSSTDLLPLPSQVADNAAYLVGTSGNYDLYAVVNNMWVNLGPIGTVRDITINYGSGGGSYYVHHICFKQFTDPVNMEVYAVSHFTLINQRSEPYDSNYMDQVLGDMLDNAEYSCSGVSLSNGNPLYYHIAVKKGYDGGGYPVLKYIVPVGSGMGVQELEYSTSASVVQITDFVVSI